MSPKKRPSSRSSGPRSAGPAVKGRHWVIFWLACFLGVALTVIWRQSAALETSRELQQLRRTRGALDVSKSATVGEINRAKSRGVLVPLAQQKLGLRLPQDSEIIILQDHRQH